MTTLDNPSISQFLVYKLGKAITARKEAKTSTSTHTGTWVTQIVRLMLHLAGFGCLTYAGFEWSTIAGFVIAGLSFFALSTLITNPASPKTTTSRDPMADRRS